jgi:GNAT superfamily N-acetyltransferase
LLIERLSSAHDRSLFDCGEPSLNTYLRQYALQNDKKGLGRTFVALEPGNPRIYGYYTLSTGAVTFDKVPQNLPRYPVPVAHLGRLAVDLSLRGTGARLGETLLLDALRRAVGISEQIGLYAVEVWALNASARDFYLKYGFGALLDDQNHLYLPMKSVRKLKLL